MLHSLIQPRFQKGPDAVINIKKKQSHLQTDCVYKQQTCKVLSPCINVLFTILCFTKSWTSPYPCLRTTELFILHQDIITCYQWTCSPWDVTNRCFLSIPKLFQSCCPLVLTWSKLVPDTNFNIRINLQKSIKLMKKITEKLSLYCFEYMSKRIRKLWHSVLLMFYTASQLFWTRWCTDNFNHLLSSGTHFAFNWYFKMCRIIM